MGYIEDLARNNPSICSISELGKSVENRALKLLTIGSGDIKIWIDGGNYSTHFHFRLGYVITF